MKYFFVLAAMLIIHFSLIRADHKVIDSAASSRHALVVNSQALKSIKLDPNHMDEYAENVREGSGNLLDTAMFLEIINNAGSLDTAAWKDEDLKNLLIVNNSDEEISKKYLIEKLNLSGKKQIRFYTRQINKYNDSEALTRKIYYFSKPVYSNSHEYAIVQWNNGLNGLSGEGGIDLYHLQGKEWIKVGVVSTWKN